jgi:2,4-dienoyl-CoA reductase-like NADH-dependent reductase (Old Yellow Enzyme family)
MAVETDVLFQPLRIRSMNLKNRIVMAPMTRSFARNGFVGQEHADYYRRRAEGGTGLILTEGVLINRAASHYDPDVPQFYDEKIEGWRAVVADTHKAGSAIAPQLWHTGSCKSMTADWEPDVPVESPSGLYAPGQPRGEAMTEKAIAETVDAFAKAAADAKRLGFDCVEVHGAHGYLIDQFFWNETNLRTDRYGGTTLRERSRFAAEVIAAIRAAVGPDYPLILRVSQWKQQDFTVRLASTPQEMTDWLAPLVEAGVDVIHCSQRRFWEPEFPEIDGENGLNMAGWAKKLTGAFTISVGSVGLDCDLQNVFRGQRAQPASIDGLIRRMAREEFDLIAIGRALIVDPDWANKVRDGRLDELTPFSTEALAQFR